MPSSMPIDPADVTEGAPGQARPATVLVLGAGGRLGQACTRAFNDAGWTVVAQFRRPPPQPLPTGVTAIVAPLTDSARIVAAAQGAEVVVSALSPSQYTLAGWRREALPLLQSASAIARTLAATLLWPGSVYSYGRRLPEVLDEDTPHRPDTPFGRIRHDLEDRLRRAALSDGPPCVIIRAGDFYGAGRGSWLDQVMLKDPSGRQITLLADPGIEHAWAYLPDLARSFVRVAEARARLDPFTVLHFPGHAVTGHDWQAALDNGQARRLRRFPWLLTKLAGYGVPMLAALCQQRYLWQRPHRLTGTRLAELIGPVPHTPFREAARNAAREIGWPMPEHQP